MTAPEPQAWSARMPLTIGLIGLAVLLGGFGSWSVFSEISGAIIAPGLIEVDQNRQVVQHPDGGVVSEILVDEGDTVAAGDVLIRLDPTQLQSQLSITENQLFELMARRGRLEAERDGRDIITFPELLSESAKTNSDAAELIAGQERLLRARAASDAREIEQLDKRAGQIVNQVEGIEAQQTSLTEQLSLIRRELQDQQQLLDKGLAQATRVLTLQREEARLSGQMGELTAQIAQAKGRIIEIELEISKLQDQRREESITNLRDLQYRELELSEQRRALIERLKQLDITSPVNGVVYGLQVYALRSVLRPADPIMFIVPQDRPLVIAAQVDPIHIDQIHVDQDVILRFSTLDQRTTPELMGTVRQISADAFQDQGSMLSYYRAEIALSEGEQAKLPEGTTLIPGMPVEAFVRTEDRTPLAYLVKPLTDYFAKAFRE